MKRAKIIWVIFTLTVFLGIPMFIPYLSAAGVGEASEVEDFDDISIEELLNTEVEVAGKTKQKISKAPAIVSVITAEDIRNSGALNLYEVLSLIPGINVTETYFGYSAVNFRGTLQSHYNNKSLLLLNNHPLFETALGTYYLEQVPINIIKRIEIIRGPGSTLYGTNAYTGVIKIITYDGGDLHDGRLSILGGSFGTLKAGAAYGKSFKNWKLAFAANVMDSSGYDYIVGSDEEGHQGIINYESDFFNGFLSLSYKRLKINVSMFRFQKDKFGIIPTLVSTGKRRYRGVSADMSYGFDMGKKLKVRLSGYYDWLTKEDDIDWYPPLQSLKDAGAGEREQFRNSGYKAGVELQTTYRFSDGVTLIGGLLYEYQHTGSFGFYVFGTDTLSPFGSSAYPDAHHSYDVSGYVQLDARLSPAIGLVGGVRYNYNKAYGSKVVPRGGLVYSLSDSLSIKLLYGKAFRRPNFFEQYVETRNILYGSKDLQPEEIETVDLGLDYLLDSKNSLRVNYFYTSTGNLITRSGVVLAGERDNTQDTPRYANSSGQRFHGIEAEVKGAFSGAVFYFANVSYVAGKEKEDHSMIDFVPEVSGNFGLTWKPRKQLSISSTLQYIEAREGILAGGEFFSVDSQLLLHGTVTLRPFRWLTVQVIGRNITGLDMMVPEYIRRNIGQIPGGPGQAFYFKAVYTF